MAARASAIPEKDLIDVRRAAALVGRHPETVRRWVWSGRVAAHRRGHRILVAQADIEAMVREDVVVTSLRDWVERARKARIDGRQTELRGSAADLVIEDRTRRSKA